MKQRTRILRLLAALLGSAVLVATACGPGGPATTGTPDETPVPGGRVIEGSFSDIRTVQPILVTDTPSAAITGLIYGGMITADPQSGEAKPGMAKFEVAKDGKSLSLIHISEPTRPY